MLSEALRVSQKGASIGFTIYGREGNFRNYELLVEVLQKHELLPKPTADDKPKKTIYDLSKDHQMLKQEMESMGFANVRMWYQTQNFNFKDAEEYCLCYCETVTARNILSKFSEEKAKEFREDLKRHYELRMGNGILDPMSFEITVITATKI
ncbi:hypothetical protein FGO68_gene14111 [Halteria grandinella]|uniref:Uncharacterized protein n=1 Tax=Halteria grandinella TaxID=5974 RepID=A0A8J8T053_HALGN|nr:hypothetical protein FGO68_gene14111 [Halteria grandinella]